MVLSWEILVGRSVGFALERLLGVERGLKGVADAAEDFSFCSRAGVFEFGFLEKVGEVGAFMVAVRAHDMLCADKQSYVSQLVVVKVLFSTTHLSAGYKFCASVTGRAHLIHQR